MDIREGLKASGCAPSTGSAGGSQEYGVEFSSSSSFLVATVVTDLADTLDL